MKIFSFIGNDGSGKSTIINALDRLIVENGYTSSKKWLAYNATLVGIPVKIYKSLFIKNSFMPGGYDQYHSEVKKSMAESSFKRKAYLGLSTFEYSIEIWGKIIPDVIFRRIDCLLSDRYIFDTCVAFACNLCWSEIDFWNFLSKVQFITPKPKSVFWVDTPPEICFRRKLDIPSLRYLKERYYWYNLFFQKSKDHGYNVTRIDGTLPPSEIATHCLKEVTPCLKKH